MKILVTGSNGQLGQDVVKALLAHGHEVIGCGTAELPVQAVDSGPSPFFSYQPLNITDERAVGLALSAIQPGALIHCAAWTAVDAAENPLVFDEVWAVNAIGSENLAKACAAVGAKMLYISTDYVFDGHGETPWPPDSRDFGPLNVYGKSKLEGEEAVRRHLDRFFVARVSWLYGLGGKNFVKTMLRAGCANEQVRVVCDQVGTPTYTADVAAILAAMVVTNQYGHYHVANSGGYISWQAFCEEIYRQAGLSTRVIPVTTAEYGLLKAIRPMNSRLDIRKLCELGIHPPHWQDALRRFLAESCMADELRANRA